jgi:DNA-binding NarL/FixJ family response regulator
MGNVMQTPVRRFKAIIVEDSLRMQDILIGAVQAVAGLEFVGASDTAADALADFESHRPDVVILDLVLRLGSGLDILTAIKRRAPGCLVLVFSAYDSEPYRTRCLGAGADYFFSKMRQHRELVQLLHELGGDSASVRPITAVRPH